MFKKLTPITFIGVLFFSILFSLSSFGQGGGTITYPPIAGPFIVGKPIPTISPAVTGATVTGYTINLTLPGGLIFNNTNGVISGTPNSVSPATTYTVTGTTAAAPLTTTVTITVNNPTPPVVTYPSPNTFNVNQNIPTLTPTSTGTPVTSYTLEPGSPALPNGLILDGVTGQITGKPSAVSTATEYTIRATGGPVSSTAKLTITVNDPSIPSITYNTSNIFTFGTAIPTLAPTIVGGPVTGFAITPDIHTTLGLNFDAATGIITGAPNTASGYSTYVVTAHIASGDRFANIAIKVVPAPPGNTYQPSIVSTRVDTVMRSIRPVNGDTTYSYYKIDDELLVGRYKRKRQKLRNSKKLPDGLVINSATGEISGTPTKASPPTDYTIIATNINGQSTTYKVNIGVVPFANKVIVPASITFVGQGDIQQSLNTGSKIAANTGLGVVYRENSNRGYGVLHNIEIDFSVNVASTVDTIKSQNNISNKMVKNPQDFGSSVLLPLNSGQAFSFAMKGYFTNQGGVTGNFRRNAAPKPLGGVLSGFNIALSGSNRNWADVDSAKGTPLAQIKTSLLSFYAGPFFEFITPTSKNQYGQTASVTIGAGYSARWILGDAQQTSQSMTRNKLLGLPAGSNVNSFNGVEIFMSLRFYNIKAEVHLPFLTNKNSIPGLTGSHLTTFIGFSGGFPIDLNKPAN